MAHYTALAPIVLGGAEVRSGDAFEAEPAVGDALVGQGLARTERAAPQPNGGSHVKGKNDHAFPRTAAPGRPGLTPAS